MNKLEIKYHNPQFYYLIVISLLLFLLSGCFAHLSHRAKGDQFYTQKDYGAALNEYNLAFKEFQNDRDFLMNLAQTYWKLNHLKECEATLNKVLAINKNDLEALRKLAMLYNFAKMFDKAEKLYIRILNIDKKDVVARNNLGIILAKHRKFNAALKQFEFCIKEKETFPDPFLNTANLYSQNLNDDETAYYFYEKFLNLAPNANLANDVKNWIKEYDLMHTGENYRALSLDHFFKGEKFLRSAEFEKALTEYKKAAKLFKDARYFFKCGLMEKELGDYNKAIEDIQHSLDINPNDFECRYVLGWVYKLAGNNKLAKKQWELVLKAAPENKKAMKALKTL